MPTLSEEQKSQLRKKYEKLGPHQGGLPTEDPTLRQLETDEIKRVFKEYEADDPRWQTFTNLEDHFRNVATLRKLGQSPQSAPL
jgi:hypothetical protein